MKELGLFGVMIPEEYGGLGRSLLTYAMCVEELARGWMSVSGVVNTHFIVRLHAHAVRHRRAEGALPAADGHRRDPRRLLDVRARARLRRRGDHEPRPSATSDGNYVLDGQKMWLTNGGSSTLVAVLVKTDEGADTPHRT